MINQAGKFAPSIRLFKTLKRVEQIPLKKTTTDNTEEFRLSLKECREHKVSKPIYVIMTSTHKKFGDSKKTADKVFVVRSF
ncbi:hypothetical protein RJF_0102 [Candidozyma auris]